MHPTVQFLNIATKNLVNRLNTAKYLFSTSNEISFDKPNLFYQPKFDTTHNLHSKYNSNLQFNDKIRIRCVGGSGGQGCVSFEPHARRRGKPDGGSGGIGGDMIIKCIDSIGGFNFSKRSFQAANGGNGYCKKQHGSRGKDYIVTVPMGTVVKQMGSYRTYDKTKDNYIFEKDNYILTELMTPGDCVCVAKGGIGGKGNLRLKSDKNNHPRWSEMGDKGEEILLELELKSIADIGFVGYPNAGKSTLLSAISKARPCISSLPFTTLNPHIGHCNKRSFADIPGIIEGASYNKGLGLQFLKHIERCKVLIYILDIIGTDNRCPVEDFNKLRYELYCYNPDLLSKKPSIIFANKCDIIDDFNSLYKGQLIGYKNKNELIEIVNERINKLKEIVVNDKIPIIKGSGIKKQIDDLLLLSENMIKEYDKSMHIIKEKEKKEEIWTKVEKKINSDSSDEDIPLWGNVTWYEDINNKNSQIYKDDKEFSHCNTKIQHQSASKQYYQKFDTNKIYRYEDRFQQTTKHTNSTPDIEYDSFQFEDESSKEFKDATVIDNNNNQDELGHIFDVHTKYKNDKHQKQDSKFQNLKNLR